MRNQTLFMVCLVLLGLTHAGAVPAREASRPPDKRLAPAHSDRGGHAARDTETAPPKVLIAGIKLFNNGDFNDAIAVLGAANLSAESNSTQAEALKYIAFSYCVTKRPRQCRQNFDMAFKVDQDFALTRGEQRHPMWGPVFNQARLASELTRSHAQHARADMRTEQMAAGASAQQAVTGAPTQVDAQITRIWQAEENESQRRAEELGGVRQVEQATRARQADENARSQSAMAAKRAHQVERMQTMELWQNR